MMRTGKKQRIRPVLMNVNGCGLCKRWWCSDKGCGGRKIWTRYSGHCFSHLKWNLDTGAKIGHICLIMREKSMGTASQKLDE